MLPFPAGMMGAGVEADPTNLSFESDLYHWWDPNVGVTTTSGNVTGWVDKIASLNIVGSPGAGSIPVSNINGYTVIRDVKPANMGAYDTFNHADKTMTFIVVGTIEAVGATGGRIISCGNLGNDSDNADSWALGRDALTAYVKLYHNNLVSAAAFVGYDTPFVIVVVLNETAGTLDLWVNGSFVGSIAKNTALQSGSDLVLFEKAGTIFGGAAGQGKVGDLQVVNRVLTPTEIGEAATFFKARYDLRPSNSVAPAISGTFAIGNTLAVSNGTWSFNPTGYTYQWKRDGVAIGGATANTYLLVSGDDAYGITCTVTATNANGATSADSGPIGLFTWVRARCAATAGAYTGACEVEFFVNYGSADISTAGNAIAESAFGGLPASNAFDNNNTTDWASNGTGTAAWIGQHLSSAQFVTGFSYALRNGAPSQLPTRLILEGSRNSTNGTDGTWGTIIDTGTISWVGTAQEKKSWSLAP